MKTAFLYLIILVMFSACSESEVGSCVKGKVIGYEPCSSAVLVQVESAHRIGESLDYYGVIYENVVRAPGEAGQYGDSTIFFRYRKYHELTDSRLFRPVICPAIYAPFFVPTIVITDYSVDDCPSMLPGSQVAP